MSFLRSSKSLVKTEHESQLLQEHCNEAIYQSVSDGIIIIDDILAIPLEWQSISYEYQQNKRVTRLLDQQQQRASSTTTETTGYKRKRKQKVQSTCTRPVSARGDSAESSVSGQSSTASSIRGDEFAPSNSLGLYLPSSTHSNHSIDIYSQTPELTLPSPSSFSSSLSSLSSSSSSSSTLSTINTSPQSLQGSLYSPITVFTPTSYEMDFNFDSEDYCLRLHPFGTKVKAGR